MSIILRDYTEKDFEAYSRLKMDAETMYYLQDIQLHPVEEARRDFAEVLSVLKEADLIRDEREGKFIYYELNTTVLEEIMLWITELKGGNDHDQTT